MDPASFAVSVATVVETAAKLVELLHDIKEGGKQRIRLTAEISSLWLVLENVKSQLEELSSSASQEPTLYLKTLSQPNGPLAQCSTLLNTLYDKCKPQKGTARVLQSLKWTFDKDEVDRYLDAVHRLQGSINLAYAQTALALLNTVAEDTAVTRQALEGQDLQKLLDWLSPIDFEAQQRQAFAEWCPGTVEWIFDMEAFKVWTNLQNPYLWMPAAPGCGKTILSSLIIRNLRTLASREQDTIVLGVYLTSRSTGHDDSVFAEILGSLIKQLCLLGYGPDGDLRELFHAGKGTRSTLGIEDAICHLKRLMAPVKRAYLVIDAMDELQPHRRRIKLIEYLKELSPSLSILIASRPYQEIANLCAPLHHVCDVCDGAHSTEFYHCDDHLQGGWDICPNCFADGHLHCPDKTHQSPQLLTSGLALWFEPHSSDIRLYARKRIENDEHLEGLLGSKISLKQEVIYKIVSESNNRFLTAKLYLNHLTTFDRAKDIRVALQTPLGNLDQTYMQALESLNQQRPDRVRLARETITWVLFAREPMKAAELEQAVQFGLEGDLFDEDDIIPTHRLLEFCCGFLTQSHAGHIEFIHFTADEFLSKVVREWFPSAESDITNHCLKFLSREEFGRDWFSRGTASVLELEKQYPFHIYAARCWSLHVRSSIKETSSSLAMTFLRSKAHVSTASLSVAMSSTTSFDLGFEHQLTGLHMAASSSLEFLLLRLIEERTYTDMDQQDYLGRTPLLLAAKHGHQKAVLALLNAGASPDKADHSGWTPLLVAINRFEDGVVDALTFHPSRPADVNLVGSGKGFPAGDVSPLMTAVLAHNGIAMRLLLKRPDLLVDAEVSNVTALYCCATKGNVESARLLLGHETCNVNHVSNGISPLIAASIEGHVDMIKLLVANGADVDLKDDMGRSPILAAISRSCYEAVLTLLHFGASLGVQDNNGRGVLHIAARAENTEILKLLWSYKQVPELIDTRDNSGDTPLHIALRWGFEHYAAILVAFGASTDIVSKDGQTPRQLAEQKGFDLFAKSETKDEGYDSVWMADVLLITPKKVD